MPSNTSVKRVVSGEQPMRTMSGSRKSVITFRAANSVTKRRASGWCTATWLPRHCASRGVDDCSPNWSHSSNAKPVSARALAAMALDARLASTSAMPSSAAARARIDGVPSSTPADVRLRRERRAHVELIDWANQPQIGCGSVACS